MIQKPTPQERAMKVQEVLMRAMSGEFTWIQAADLLGVTPRTMRRRRRQLERYPVSAFITCGGVDLDQILCFEEERVVQRDNTLGFDGVRLQIPKQPGRATCAGLHLIARRHLDQTYSVWRANHRLATYDARGRIAASKTAAPRPPREFDGAAA